MGPDLDQAFGALADGTRREMIAALGPRALRSGELARVLGRTAPVVSRHLGVLRRAGFVEEIGDEDDARVRMYRLRREPFGDLALWLGEVERFWAAQLDAFAAHVTKSEREGRRVRRRRSP